MSNAHNERYGDSLLRRITGQTVLNEAKRMLLARAGVTNPRRRRAGDEAFPRFFRTVPQPVRTGPRPHESRPGAGRRPPNPG